MVNRWGVICAVLVVLTFAAPARAEGVFPFFEPPETLGDGADRIVALDFNGDGWADVAGVQSRAGKAMLVLNGEEEFADAQTVALGDSTSVADAVAAGDLDGDGRDELLATLGESGTLAVFSGRASGGLGAPDVYPLRSPVGTRGTGVAVADVDGDGDLDVLAAFGESATVLLNDGHGTLTPGAAAVTIPNVGKLLLVKLGGDDDPDLVVLSPWTVSVLPGAAGAGFGSPVDYPLAADGTAIASGDVNGDGRPDIAVTYEWLGLEPTSPALLLGKADGGLTPVRGALTADAVVLADFDGDGAIDEYTAGIQPRFLTGGGPFTFRSQAQSDTARWEWSLAAADFDHDGKLDIASASEFADVTVRYATGPQLIPSDANTFLGEATLGYAGGGLAVPFTNEGGGVARDLEPVVEGDTDDFAIDMNTCDGAVLKVEENCWIFVNFKPKTVGEKSIDVGLAPPDSRILWSVTLDGTAEAAPPHVEDPGQPQLVIGTVLRPGRISSTPQTSPRITAIVPGAPSFARPTLASLRRSGLRVTQRFGTAERVTWTLEYRGTVLARAQRSVRVGSTTVTLKLSSAGKRLLLKRKPASLTLRTKGTLERVTTVKLRRG